MWTHLQFDSLKYSEAICTPSVLCSQPTAQSLSAHVRNVLAEHWLILGGGNMMWYLCQVALSQMTMCERFKVKAYLLGARILN